MGRRAGAAIFAAVMLLAGAAEAKSFVALRAPDGSMTLIDPSTVETEGTIRRTWTVTVRRNILDNGPPEPGYVRVLQEHDCARGMTRWRRLQAFSRTGASLVSQENPSAEWTNANQGDALVAHRVVCGRSQGDSVISADTIGAVVVALLSAFDPAPAALPPSGRQPAESPPASSLDEKTRPLPPRRPPAKAPPAPPPKGRRI